MTKNKLRILALGAGVQSSALAFLVEKKKLPPVDAAIFADTGGEPAAVYEWLDYIKKNVSYPVHIVQKGNLTNDIKDFVEGKYGHLAIPLYTKAADGSRGMIRRTCTNNYKIKPVIKKVRELLGYAPGERVPYNGEYLVDLIFGISRDEMIRIKRNELRYIENQYPLIYDLKFTRQDCLNWLKDNNYPMPIKSACYYCPFHSNGSWLELKNKYPKEWEQAVKMDYELRKNNKQKSIKDEMYLHRSCEPLDIAMSKEENQLDLFPAHLDPFNDICDEGMCGV